jgi:predicted permease
MDWLRILLSRCAALLHRQRLDRDLDEEVQTHLSLAVEENLRRGMRAEEARTAALRDFGGVAQISERYRMQRGLSFLDVLGHDIRFGLRQLRKSPGFTLTAILTLALGIGANTAIFTLVHAVMLKTLPVADPQHIYRVGADDICCVWGGTGGTGGDWSLFSTSLYEYLREHTPAFEEMAAFSTINPKLSIRRSGSTAPADAFSSEFVSGNYFSMFGLHAFSGRLFAPADDVPGATPVTVLSYRVWRECFAADPSMVGSTAIINGSPFTIAGIAPPGFFGDRLSSEPPEFWIPIHQEPVLNAQSSILHLADKHWLYVMGRVEGNLHPAEIQAQMTLEIQQWLRGQSDLIKLDQATLLKQHVRLSSGGAGITGLRDYYEKGLYLLLAISILVLLIACANLANLLLVRDAARRRQILVRLALGASRERVLRAVLTESILLSILGGFGGLLIAYAGTKGILLIAFGKASDIPINSGPSWLIVGFAFALSLITGVVFGMVPAWITSNCDPAEALRTAHHASHDRLVLPQRSLIVIQAAFSLILLSFAGLLTKSLNNLENYPFGFEADGRFVVQIDPQIAGYKPEQLPALYRQLQDQLSQIPGVLKVGLSSYGPQESCCWNSSICIEGQRSDTFKSNVAAWLRVSPHFFETIATPLVHGRFLGDQDTPTSRRVAVIDESFARKFFAGKNPIGQHFGMDLAGHSGDYEVVGVVKDTQYMPPNTGMSQNPMFFLPLEQTVHYQVPSYNQTDTSSLYIGRIELHVASANGNIEAAVRRTLESVDPNLTVLRMSSMKEQVAFQFNQQRLIARLTSLYSLLALILASVGLYGITAYTVAGRTSEIGIRMALGANRLGVVSMVLRGAFLQTGIGLVLGIPFAFIGGHLISNQLYKTKSYDPLTFVGATVLLLLCALIAGVLPARRASSIDPIKVLRTE